MRLAGWVLIGWGSTGVGGCDGSTIALLPSVPGAAGAGSDDDARCGEGEVCDGRRSVCDQLKGLCVECVAAADCDGNEACDTLESRCRHTCTADLDCEDGDDDQTLCDTSRGFCVECTTDAACASEPRTTCMVSTGECVECLSDDYCGAGEPHCDPDSWRCEECLLDEHCGEGGTCDRDDERCL